MLKSLAKTTKKVVKNSKNHDKHPPPSEDVPRTVPMTPSISGPGTPAPLKSILRNKDAFLQEEARDLEIVKYSAPFRILEASSNGNEGLSVQVTFASASCVNIVNKSFVDMTGLGKLVQKHEECIEIRKAGADYDNVVYGYVYLTLAFADKIKRRLPFLVLRHTLFPVIWGRDGNQHMSHLDTHKRTLYGVSFADLEHNVDVPAVKLMQGVPTASIYKVVRAQPQLVSLLPWTVEDVVVNRPLPERIIYIKGMEHKVELLGDGATMSLSSHSSTTSLRDASSTPFSSNRSSPGPELVENQLEDPFEELNRKTLNDLMSNKQIRPSQSKILSPIVWDYETATFRVDYTELNGRIAPDTTYKMPKPKHLINQVGHGKIFSCLKLLDAYRQVPLREEDRHLTAFLTPYGKFEYNVLPHGLLNSDISLQRTIDTITRTDFASSYAVGYLDTIVIHSQTKAAHSEHTMRILEMLAANGLYVDLDSYDVFQQEVEFLDHTIGHGQIRPGASCVERIKAEYADVNTFTVLSQKEARAFLTKAGYFRRFLKNYARLTEPLHDYVYTFDGEWDEECTHSLQGLVAQLDSNISLVVPDLTENNTGFIIESCIPADCQKIISAQLLQPSKDENAEPRVVEYFSKRLTHNDSVGLSRLEKEIFALVQAVEHWKPFAKKGQFTVRARGQVLEALTKNVDNSTSITRIKNWRQTMEKCHVVYELPREHEKDDSISML